MKPADEWLYEYALVRFVPEPERGEFINIGLIMMNKRKKWLKGKILINPERIKYLNSSTDIDFLKNQAKIFEKSYVPDKNLPVEVKYRWLSAVKSASLRTSPSHPGIVNVDEEDNKSYKEIMEEEFSRLFSLLVE